jgi:hypothetical protein
MPMLYDRALVDEAATFIAHELKALLDRRNLNSPLTLRLETWPTYDKLTNGDRVLATLKALNLTALEVIGDMGELTRDPPFEETILEEGGIIMDVDGGMTTAEIMARVHGEEPGLEEPQ